MVVFKSLGTLIKSKTKVQTPLDEADGELHSFLSAKFM
jgi:hypothetical protein